MKNKRLFEKSEKVIRELEEEIELRKAEIEIYEAIINRIFELLKAAED
jgi:hypothetical protein